MCSNTTRQQKQGKLYLNRFWRWVQANWWEMKRCYGKNTVPPSTAPPGIPRTRSSPSLVSRWWSPTSCPTSRSSPMTARGSGGQRHFPAQLPGTGSICGVQGDRPPRHLNIALECQDQHLHFWLRYTANPHALKAPGHKDSEDKGQRKKKKYI